MHYSYVYSFGTTRELFLDVKAISSRFPLFSDLERFFLYFLQEEAKSLDEVCGFMRWPKPFDYDQNLIPPEPNFFSTGFLMDKEDRYVIPF